jgi:HSP20 family protein
MTVQKDPFDDLQKRLSDLWRAVQGSGDGTELELEIVEDGESLIVTADMRDSEREDIRVDVSPLRVVIQAARSSPRRSMDSAAPSKPYHRTLTLPTEVRPEDAEAHFNNGILEIVLPKRAVDDVDARHVAAG